MRQHEAAKKDDRLARQRRLANRLSSTLALAACVLSVGCSKKTARAPVWATGGMGPPPWVQIDEMPLDDVKVDTLWRQLGPDVQGSPALNRRGQWLIVHTWYLTRDMPESLRTMDEMLRLQAQGRISSNTQGSLVRYSYLTDANNMIEAAESASARMRSKDWPPERVRADLLTGSKPRSQ
jgi:hypothetical protein